MIGKDINSAKADLMNEMKSLCEEIQKTQTFSGLVSLESRIQTLHEKIIILKYLDQQPWLEDRVAEKTERKAEERKEIPVSTFSEKALPKVALSLNDKIAFQNQLFNRDGVLLGEVINRLNTTVSLKEAQEVLKPYALQFNWESKEEFVERFEALIEKKFS